MANQNQEPHPPASRKGVIIGILPFLMFGIFIILTEITYLTEVPGGDNLIIALFLVTILLLYVGVVVGWIRSFPRWSYASTGMAVVMSAYMVTQPKPEIQIFNTSLSSNELMGWWAWVPLGLALVVGVLISRSLRPAVRFFAQIWDDWSLATYTMFGIMPLVVLYGFDGISHLYSLPFLIFLAIIMVTASGSYLGGGSHWLRISSITVGTLVIVVTTAAASSLYWQESGWVHLWWRVERAGTILTIILIPVALQVLRRGAHWTRTA